ncbi:RNA polymerase sigma-70 factor [Pseudoflavitalea sp. G-6-1-2]|uniref:RNA polymerase sigma-70 factor n=1 Tax=Pseudoflavitalea sp. G-6-1-2 TaxID=2728841 RepID=UPI00146CC5D6|nr:RNA polymerase sigma-70 factor [Pseudoflavitalea sp. G-6-1-2]NML23332.1 RNA polymerase sigma-70 factor [Pseudoflavitalea sp. G-6-1-2]
MSTHNHTAPGYSEFLHLFNTYREPVLAYIRTITADHDVAEELTQNIFLKLWLKRLQFSEIENKDQYIFRMAHNASMNWFKKLALDARLAGEVKRRMKLENNNVEDHIAHREANALLEKALNTLPPQRRKVFELSRRQGMKLSEIASHLNISKHTANNHLVTALSQIREYFAMHCGDTAFLILVLSHAL